MRNAKWKPLLILFALLLIFYPSFPVQAEVMSFPELYLELTLPDNTIILTRETPDSDEQWRQAGIADPKKEKKNFDEMGIQAILYDPDTDTTVKLMQKQSQKSSEVFHLSLLTNAEMTDFLNTLITSSDDTMTYTVEQYPQSEIPFFHVDIKMKTDTSAASEVIYGTVVNGDVISYDIYSGNAMATIDESFIKELVAGTHFTKYLDKTEVQRQGRQSMIVLLVSSGVMIGFVVLLIILSSRKNKKQAADKKQKSAALATFFREQAQKEEQHLKDPVLFTNHTRYSEEVVKQFCNYEGILHHWKRLVFTIVIFILLLVSVYFSKNALFYYVIGAVLIFFYIFFQGLQIEKNVKKIMKTYEKNRSMDAVVTFYEDYYTLSGIQSSSKYPYLQITEVKEYKDFVYLYLGTERALFLKKDGFEQSYQEFLTFIRNKIS